VTIMNTIAAAAELRPLTLADLDATISIDHAIRRTGEVYPYSSLTTENIFTINHKLGREKKPISYIDLTIPKICER
jgi:hypothetical protein